MPASVGGWKRVPCCFQCNQLKGDLHPETWFWFIGHVPGYWRTYRTHQEIRRAVDELRVYQARQRSIVEVKPRLPDAAAER